MAIGRKENPLALLSVSSHKTRRACYSSLEFKCLIKVLSRKQTEWVVECVMFVLQLAMRGPPGPMGLTGRSGPVVSLSFLALFYACFIIFVNVSLDFF